MRSMSCWVRWSKELPEVRMPAEVCVGAFDGAFLEGAVGVAVEDADGVLGGAEVFDGGGGAEFGAAVGEGDGEEAGRFDAVSAEALGEVLVGGGDAGGGFMLEENGDEEVAVSLRGGW